MGEEKCSRLFRKFFTTCGKRKCIGINCYMPFMEVDHTMRNYSVRTVGFWNYLRLAPRGIAKNMLEFAERYFHIIIILTVLFLMYKYLVSH